MNYRHIYHAGNFADVVKHIILMQVINRFKLKETPFFVLDTHAGTGLYNLSSEQAQKTKEADAGILSLLNSDIKNPQISEYLNLVRSFNKNGNLEVYPGSPAITANMIRAQDRFMACELHPTDYHTLSNNWRKWPNKVKAVLTDGYVALKASIPPKERRGIVLIDPPFEDREEFAKLASQIRKAVKKWNNGTYVIWFPIKKHLPVEKFYEEITAINAPKTLLVECWVADKDADKSLNGAGVIIINTPYQLDEIMEEMSAELVSHICPSGTDGLVVKWLVPPVG